MFTVRLAELNIAIDNKYEYVEDMCKDYITQCRADFTISATEAEIKAEDVTGGYTMGYLESLAVYRKIATRLLEYNGFLVHGVIMKVDDVGIALCAKSGTGKTTHSMLWKALLGDKCRIINGDKPLVRIIEDDVYAYGTPWAGKEGINENTGVRLKKLCFIERSYDNSVTPCDNKEVFERLMTQIFIPSEGSKVVKTMGLLDLFIKRTDGYIIKCNRDISAAEVAYKGIFEL